MWSIVRRAIVPALLAIAGVAALIKGALFHPISVFVEKETTTTIEVPLVLPPGPTAGDPASPGGPFGGPTFIKKTITRIDLVPLILSEPDATRDVTVGGLVRLTSGELKRTYSGKGPALCPT